MTCLELNLLCPNRRLREIRELALSTLGQMGAAAAPYGRKLGQMLADEDAPGRLKHSSLYYLYKTITHTYICYIYSFVLFLHYCYYFFWKDSYSKEPQTTVSVAAAAALEQLGAHAASAIQEMVKILWNTQDAQSLKNLSGLNVVLNYTIY